MQLKRKWALPDTDPGLCADTLAWLWPLLFPTALPRHYGTVSNSGSTHWAWLCTPPVGSHPGPPLSHCCPQAYTWWMGLGETQCYLGALVLARGIEWLLAAWLCPDRHLGSPNCSQFSTPWSHLSQMYPENVYWRQVHPTGWHKLYFLLKDSYKIIQCHDN